VILFLNTLLLDFLFSQHTARYRIHFTNHESPIIGFENTSQSAKGNFKLLTPKLWHLISNGLCIRTTSDFPCSNC